MKKIKVFVTTNYFCNYDCGYCYLGRLKKDGKVIDAGRLKEQLEEISRSRRIDEIIVAGGESFLLPLDLLQTISHICKEYAENVVFVTNFSNTETAGAIYRITGNLSVSINRERPEYEETIKRVLGSELENISLSIVATPGVIATGRQKLIAWLETLKRPALFLQYSPSIYNKAAYSVSNKDFESFLQGLVEEYCKKPRNFELINIEDLERCLAEEEEPWQDSVVFIDPYNKYAVLEYMDGKEYFKEYESIKEIEEKSARQKSFFSSRCGGCKYFGHCYAEHMKEWKNGDSCCGMKNLLKWYEKNIHKDD